MSISKSLTESGPRSAQQLRRELKCVQNWRLSFERQLFLHLCSREGFAGNRMGMVINRVCSDRQVMVVDCLLRYRPSSLDRGL